MSVAQRSLAEWLTWLGSIYIEPIQLGLERIQHVAPHILSSKIAPLVITVAGTNGKGTSVTWLSEIYRRAGYRVGQYISPHLYHYTERICINGQPVSEAQICKAFTTIDAIRGDISLSYFEFGTLAALLLFQQAKLDVVILEVGLGGRLDAVNSVDADVALITTIDFDHCEYLGSDRESIGREKAGIFRQGQFAICGDPRVPASVREYARIVGARLYCQGEDFGDATLTGTAQNAQAVRYIVKLLQDRLPVARHIIDTVIEQVRAPGRFQVITGLMTTVLDVAHNPQAVEYMRQQLLTLSSTDRHYAVFSMQKTKDIESVLRIMQSTFEQWFIAPLETAQAFSALELEANFRTADVTNFTLYHDIPAAYQAAKEQARPRDTIVVFGSFYTVAAAWYNALS